MTNNILKNKARIMKQMMNRTGIGFNTNRSHIENLKESESQNAMVSFQKPAITINTDWLSWSGHSSMILSGFKLAWLNYAPSNVDYRMKALTRDDVLVIRKYLLEKWMNIIREESFFTDNFIVPKRYFDDIYIEYIASRNDISYTSRSNRHNKPVEIFKTIDIPSVSRQNVETDPFENIPPIMNKSVDLTQPKSKRFYALQNMKFKSSAHSRGKSIK